MQGAAHLAHFHVTVLLHLGAVTQGLELCFLLFELFNFFHYSLSFLNLSFFSKFFCIFVEQVDLGLELVNFLIDAFLLECIHLGLSLQIRSWVVAALWSILSPDKTSFDFCIDLGNHLCQLHNQLVLILPLVAFLFNIVCELLLHEIVVAFFTRADVRFRVREQIIRAKRKQVVLADLKKVDRQGETRNLEIVLRTSWSSKWSLRASLTNKGLLRSLPINWSSSCLMWSIYI